MKTVENMEEAASKLTSLEIEKINILIQDLNELKDSRDINEDTLRTITTVSKESSSLRDMYIDRLMYLFKRGTQV